jgi:tetratricopeptide (TPR) repeat protein
MKKRPWWKRLLGGPQQKPDYASRILWGAVFGGLAFAAVFPFTSAFRELPVYLISLSFLLSFLVACIASILVQIGRVQPDKRLLKLLVAPALAGLLVGVIGVADQIPQTDDEISAAIEEMQTEITFDLVGTLAQATKDPAAIAFAERLRSRMNLLYPVQTGLCIGLAVAVIIAAIRLPARSPIWKRLALYGGGAAGVVVLGWLVTILLLWPPRKFLSGYLGWWPSGLPYLLFLAWGAIVDAGQLLGARGKLARHPWRALAALCAALVIMGIVFWKPVAAEYHLFRSMVADGEQPDMRRLAKAHRLWPGNGWIAFLYSDRIVEDDLGRVLHGDSDELDKAIAEYRRAIKINPDNPGHYTDLAMALGRNGRHEEAIGEARNAVEVAKQIEARKSPRPWERWYWGPDFCQEALISRLADEGSSESFQEILTYLKSDEVGSVEMHAAEVLAKHGIREAAGPIRNLLKNAEFRITPEEGPRQKLRESLEALEAPAPNDASTSAPVAKRESDSPE